MASKKRAGEGLAAFVRDAANRAKQVVEQRDHDFEVQRRVDAGEIDAALLIPDEVRPFKPRIFNILEYIEQSWGLAMRLYPVQRFIVKLYYNIPLDTTPKAIRVTDMLGTKTLYELSEREYLTYLYNEGRCNIGEQDYERRELILAVGRRAGKCVAPDSIVLTGNGLYRIEDLGVAQEDDFSPLAVTVVQEKGRRASSSAFYNGGVQPTYLVTSKSGYSLEGTGNHRIKVLTSEGAIAWRYADEICKGDYLAINRSTDLWADHKLDLRPYHNEDGRKDVELPAVLDEKLGGLLGYLVGDGSWNDGHSTALTVEHPETWERVAVLLDSVFGASRVQMDKRTANTGRLEFCSVRARRFLDAIGWRLGVERDQKMVPWAILRSPKNVVCSFLSGLFETDGSSEDGGRNITFSSASFRLAHEVQVLLLNLGIVSTVSRKWGPVTKRHYANLLIKGHASRRLFVENIGFESDKKRTPTERYLQESAQDGKSDTDSVPFQLLAIRNLLESVPKRNSGRGWGRSRLREVLGNACKPGAGEDLTYCRMRRVVGVAREVGAGAAEVKHFEELLAANYFFDEVASVVESENQVYDLSVPDGESFVANGFTNHNTTLSGVFASYEVYRQLNLGNPQHYYGLPNGNRIQIISVATDKDQAGLLFTEVTNHLAKCEYFKPYIANNTQSHIMFRTPWDIERYGPSARHQNGKFVSFNGKASLRVTFKSSIAKGLRGAGNVVIIMDEMAHYQETGVSSAKDIYDAVKPSMAAFVPKDPETGGKMLQPDGSEYPVESRMITISSPLNKSGKFYDLFHLAMSRNPGSHNMLAIQAPTWEVNPTLSNDYYAEQYHADPAVFLTEHGAQFSDRVRGWIEREADLMECIPADQRPQIMGVPRYPYQMGIDIGLIGDGTCIAITCDIAGQIVLAYHEYWQAGVDWRVSNPHLGSNYSTDYCKTLGSVDRLDFDEIGNWIHKMTKRFYITEGIFDRWNGLPLEQALLKKGLTQFKSEYFQRDLASRIYQNTKMLMFDKSLRLYNFPTPTGAKHSPLINELLELRAQQMSKNIVVVNAPQAKGHHDDMSDALVRAIWLTAERMRNEKHVYGNSTGMAGMGMAAGAAMNASRYQMMRARSHGGFGDRISERHVAMRSARMRTLRGVR